MKNILKNIAAALFIFVLALMMEIGKTCMFEEYKKHYPIKTSVEKPEYKEEEPESEMINLNKIRDVRVLKKTIEIELESGDIYILNYEK